MKHVQASGKATGRISLGKHGSEIRAAGKSRLEVSALGGHLQLKSSGAARIKFTGRADKLSLNLEDASWLDAGKLNAEQVDLESSGSTRVTLRVVDRLRVVNLGAASVDYYGKPKLEFEAANTDRIHKLTP